MPKCIDCGEYIPPRDEWVNGERPRCFCYTKWHDPHYVEEATRDIAERRQHGGVADILAAREREKEMKALAITVRIALQEGEIVNLIEGFTTPSGNGQDGSAYALSPSGHLMQTKDVPRDSAPCRWAPTGIAGLESAVRFLMEGADWRRPCVAQQRLRSWAESRQQAISWGWAAFSLRRYQGHVR